MQFAAGSTQVAGNGLLKKQDRGLGFWLLRIGKSSFTKYLGLAFDNRRTIDGTPFIKHLQELFPRLRFPIKLCRSVCFKGGVVLSRGPLCPINSIGDALHKIGTGFGTGRRGTMRDHLV